MTKQHNEAAAFYEKPENRKFVEQPIKRRPRSEGQPSTGTPTVEVKLDATSDQPNLTVPERDLAIAMGLLRKFAGHRHGCECFICRNLTSTERYWLNVHGITR